MGNTKVKIPEELMTRIASGDEKAFEQLYYLTYKPLFSYLLSLTKNPEDAADLSQETYIKVRGACHLYRDKNPMAWIMKIAKNQFISMKRKSKAACLSFEEYPNDISETNDSIKNVEDRMFLSSLLKTLASDELEIVTMHIITGLKHSEIAELLGQPLGTVLSKYHRAIKKLRKAEQEAQNAK